MRRGAALAALALAALSSCAAPESGDSLTREYGASSLARWEPATEGFVEESLPDGRTRHVFRTDDPSYLRAEGYTAWAALWPSTQFPLEATVSRQSGDAHAGCGLVFFCRRTTAGQVYMLTAMVNTRGQYCVGKYAAGEYVSILPWTHSDSLAAGYGVGNTIGIGYAGGVFTLSLNGAVQATFRDGTSPRLTTGLCGYAVTISPYEGFPADCVEVSFTR